MLQWFTRFSEFSESSAPFRENPIDELIWRQFNSVRNVKKTAQMFVVIFTLQLLFEVCESSHISTVVVSTFCFHYRLNKFNLENVRFLFQKLFYSAEGK